MKERPILFSAPMVRAILDGRKTMTRRVCKIQPIPFETSWHLEVEGISHVYHSTRDMAGNYDLHIRCPYGKPGDRLWVREAWRIHERATDLITVKYRASEQQSHTEQTKQFWIDGKPFIKPTMTWKPSIHMPRWASRITLEITNVRVERLRDICEYDAEAEGVDFCTDEVDFGKTVGGYIHNHLNGSHLAGFMKLWDKINGKKYPWASNPWVWVVEFNKKEIS